jgi:uncharacterized protein YxjI
MEFNYYNISIVGVFKRKYLIHKDGSPFLTVERRSFFSSEHIFNDVSGREIMYLKKMFSLFKYQYEIYKNNTFKGEIRKENFSNTYILDTNENHLIAKNNFTGTEFTFYNGDKEIVKGTRKIFSRENAYQLAIMEGYNDLYILATMIAIATTRQSKRRKKG